MSASASEEGCISTCSPFRFNRRSWTRSRTFGQHRQVTLQLDRARTALVLLDLQNYNVHPDGYWNRATPGAAEIAVPMIEGTVRALHAARSAGIAVIHVANSWRPGHPDVNLH